MVMNKQEYQSLLCAEREVVKQANKRMADARELYIESNKPCEKGDRVRITLESGRVVEGEANAFHILQDGNVHIASYKDVSSVMKHISRPTIKTEILN